MEVCDEGNMEDIWDITVEDVERLKRLLTPPVQALPKPKPVDGLSAMATRLGNPIMLDSYTNAMCMQSWGRLNYSRSLIDIRADRELKENMVIAIPNLEGEGDVLHMHVVDEPKKQNGKNNDDFQHAPKRAVLGINMSLKFQFKSTKQVYKPISKKSGASTSDTKKNPETTRQEASTSNPFDALMSVDNDDVLGANWGSSIGAETVVDEGQKANPEPVQILMSTPNDATPVNEVQLANEQLSPTLSNVIGSNIGKNKVSDVAEMRIVTLK
ncbi:reverse transcriptase domain-containing protein [Artemisia annua]|uniref:Reverse transcriptase domain-containing protein n=1 Tax=Artemisia annua TaxID=35608 RepID=A0A2U1MBU5_ARTAN|nr:reverse transcriptase domain-containing protein [Artemisia annua]